MKFKEKQSNKYQLYAITHKYLMEWIDRKDEELKDEPNFLKLDWNDKTIVENYMFQLIHVIPFYCQFPCKSFLSKLVESKILKSLKPWVIKFTEIEGSVDTLVNKYTELKKDEILFLTSLYVKSKCTNEILLIIALYHREINLDIKKYFENLKKKIKETPKNATKSTTFTSNLSKAMKGEISSTKKNENCKDELYTFDNLFDSKKITAQSITDNLLMAKLLQTQKILGNKKGPSALLSILPGAGCREILRQIPLDTLAKYNQRELYRDLFNFLYVIAIDERLLSERDYDAKEKKEQSNIIAFPYKSFKDYMENKAKIIFGLT